MQRFQLYHQRLLVNILFLTNEGVLPKKDSLQKAAAINRCEYSGFELTYRDSGSTNHFLIFTMQIFPPSQKITIPKYNAVSYSLAENLSSALVKNNVKILVVDKSRTCVCCVLEIINFANCHA